MLALSLSSVALLALASFTTTTAAGLRKVRFAAAGLGLTAGIALPGLLSYGGALVPALVGWAAALCALPGSGREPDTGVGLLVGTATGLAAVVAIVLLVPL